MKRIFTCNVPEDENSLVQTRLGGEFWASDVVMHKAHWMSSEVPRCFSPQNKSFIKNYGKNNNNNNNNNNSNNNNFTSDHEGENLIKQSFQSRLKDIH